MVSLGSKDDVRKPVVGAVRAAVDGDPRPCQLVGGSILQPNDGGSRVYLCRWYGGCDPMYDVLDAV